MRSRRTYWALLLAVALAALDATGQNWTRFRGPNGTGISNTKGVPTTWRPQDLNWKVPLPGSGAHSSPVVWKDQIFLSNTDAQGTRLVCFALGTEAGELLWRREFPFRAHQIHKYNSFASSTPAVDENHVYYSWATPQKHSLTALDHEGNVVWERDLGPYVSQHGYGASPIVFNGKVIMANDQDGESFLLAVDGKTGETVWRTPRRSAKAAYSTPCVYYQSNREPVLIFNSWAHGMTAIAPNTGEVAWELPGIFDKRSVSSPVLAGGLLFGSCGSGGGGNYVVAVRPGDKATGAQPELAYTIRRSAPYVPTPVALNELVFFWSDQGIVTCVYANTGKIMWRERVGGNFFGSPVLVDGRIFCVSTTGEVAVIAATGQYALLARNQLNELTRTTPAVAGGRMYIRTLNHLYSVGGGVPSPGNDARENLRKGEPKARQQQAPPETP